MSPSHHHNGSMAICTPGHTYVRLHIAGIQKILSRKIQKQYDTNKNHVNFIMVLFLVYINKFFLFLISVSCRVVTSKTLFLQKF